jgi:phosphatidylserine/phosphatidylglycerophosphate/cardiolipin synthase-like enzyme
VDITLYSDREETLTHLIRKINAAKRSIDVTHFTPSAPPWTSLSEQRYYAAYAEAVKARRVRVRRILLINSDAQLQWAKDLLAEYAGFPLFLACYAKERVHVPHITIVIIDGNEVRITGGERSPSISPKALSVRHPHFATVFQEHFDALWRNGLKLNDPSLRVDLLTELETALQAP